MRRVRWGWVGLCVGCLLGGSAIVHAASFDPHVRWDRLKTPHFTIVYPQPIAALAQIAGRYAEGAYAILSPKYQWKPLGRVTIVLTDNNDQPNGLATVLPYNILFLRAAAPDATGALASYDNWLRLLITHELTHIMHMDQGRGIMRVPRAVLGKVVSPNGIMPGWMREGLAVQEESVNTAAGRNRGSFGDMLLRTAVLQRNWQKIDQADGLQWRWPGFLPQYIYGGKFVEWLTDKFGADKVIEFQTRSARSVLFFMHNHIAKRVWKKSFYQLWKQWRDEASVDYQAQIVQVQAAGETPTQVVVANDATISALGVSPDGAHLVYSSTDPHRPTTIRWRSLVDGTEQILRNKQGATAASIDPTGTKVAYSSPGVYKRYNFFSDVYLYDVAAKKVTQITTGKRASDPTFSPDGKELLFAVDAQNGTQTLVRHDLATHREQTVAIAAPLGTRFARPQWSPNGKMIAVSSHQGATHDLYLYAPSGKLLKRITADTAIDASPAWDASGRFVYFSSDRSGISNIYRYDTRAARLEQMTNVVTGAFEPKPSPDGASLYVQYYNGQGYDVRKVALATKGRPIRVGKVGGAPERSAAAAGAAPPGDAGAPFAVKKYSPWTSHLFLPRYLIPGVIATGDAVIFSAVTGGADPLRWHNWQAGMTYRTDAKYMGYLMGYTYNRYKPVWSLGVLNYPVDSGRRFSDETHIFEKRLRGYAGVSLSFPHSQAVSLAYFLENRDLIPDVTAADRAAFFNLDRFGGVSATYAWGRLEQYPASISVERGHRLAMNLTVTNKFLGSDADNEQQVFSGEWRHFFPLPWLHNVIAARIKGGIALGDPQKQGSFSVGGALGEGAFAGGGGFSYFPLRGLPVAAFSGTRAALASVEYRFPLLSPQRGLGTAPVHLQNAHAAVFADYGNAWNSDTAMGSWPLDRFLLGTGVEVRGDFIVGHGLPVSGRLGYGIIVHNRDRASAFTDPLLKSSVKNGTLIFQIGTSF